ncbi:MAG: hypothetical protein COU40_01195 [Candidatus Moranbacteria bacterium CG10_big_fil_rev_8_21_14_0_10_35_21]|nr:MAG: hypothetical protein COU40_01195 [Candidatus Moranbacteria bacterium CG10_big_fil_rev_8_21_14_0_10_35_21]
MKLFLIKVGKAFSVLKRDGLFQGGRRLLEYLKSFFQNIFQNKSGDILILTGGVGDSALYRSIHLAEELNIHGFSTVAIIQDRPFLKTLSKKFKIFIFHRVIWTGNVAKLVNEIKKQQKEIIFETDDLVFDSKYYRATEQYAAMNFFQKKQYATGIGEEILKDPYVKTCTCTTSYLAKELEKYPARDASGIADVRPHDSQSVSDVAGGNKKVFIIPNKLSNKDLEVVDDIMKHKTCNIKHKTHEDGKKCYMLHASGYMIKIGYFSGSGSHNKDFAEVSEALMAIMEKYSNVELFLAGPLDLENKLNKFKDRIKQIPYVPRAQHFANLSQIDINLAPLEKENPFCEAKSELKFFEAGILCIPTVATRNQTFSEAIIDGQNGFLAGTTEEWIEKLEKLILEPNLRLEMGQKARNKALADYTTKNSHNLEFYDYLKNRLNKAINT